MGKDSFAPGRSLLSSAPSHGSVHAKYRRRSQRATFTRRISDSLQSPILFATKDRNSQTRLLASTRRCRFAATNRYSKQEPHTNIIPQVTPRRAPTSSRLAALSATTSRRARATRSGMCFRLQHLRDGFALSTTLETFSTSALHLDANYYSRPNLHGLWGRKTGEVEGYAYSDANKGKGIHWGDDTLVRVSQYLSS
jgi:hypothetical protein